MTELLSNDIPVNSTVTMQDLVDDPYRVYKSFRADSPIVFVEAAQRVFVTKAEDTKFIKTNPEIFSAWDHGTPMETAFQGNTLMRKDGDLHQIERLGMAPCMGARAIRDSWDEVFRTIAHRFVNALPRGETIDLFPEFAAPFAASCLKHVLGLEEATDSDMIRWSQTLIDGAGNYGWDKPLFDACEHVNHEVNAMIAKKADVFRTDPNGSGISAMLAADSPLSEKQIQLNTKIAIGGGINEPRDALCTTLFGLFTNPEQFEAVKKDGTLWKPAFEEAVRWVAPIQISVRKVKQEHTLRGVTLPVGQRCMTIQASANHDEEFWATPEVFDIFRDKVSHQSFGNGPHFCMGAHVARKMLADILLPMLIDRFPNLTLPDPAAVVWKGFAFRGPLNLPVTLN